MLGFRPNSANAQALEVIVIDEATTSQLIEIIQAMDLLNQRAIQIYNEEIGKSIKGTKLVETIQYQGNASKVADTVPEYVEKLRQKLITPN